MNKREKAELMNLVTPLENLFYITSHIDEYLLDDVEDESGVFKKNVDKFKEKLMENLEALDDTKDFFSGIVHLKVASEEIQSIFYKKKKKHK